MATKDVIAANLRVLRKVRHMSQPDLAGQVGISPRTVARLEAAQVADPSINHVRALAQALGVTVDLLTESELAPLTIAVPARLKPVLEAPAGMRWLAETLEEGRLSSRHAVPAAVSGNDGVE
jgi:transcriptional regulator with XRE-family HTH domain